MRACSAWPGADQAVNSPCRFLAEEEQRPSALLAWAFAETQAGREPMSPGSSISRSVVRQESPVSPLKQAVIAYLENAGAQVPQDAQLDPIRQAYRMDKGSIALELRETAKDFSAGGDASRSYVRRYVYLPELREHLVVMLNGTAPRDGVY
ncbi:MAG: hypothetical protein MHM6MM_009498, partial [Cercozoa sp. M6MM]